MKTMFLAAAAVLGIGMSTAYAGDEPVAAQQLRPKTEQSASIVEAGDAIGSRAIRSLPNPTGQTWYGPHGEISLWDPNPNW
jgi:hypothetical protein